MAEWDSSRRQFLTTAGAFGIGGVVGFSLYSIVDEDITARTRQAYIESAVRWGRRIGRWRENRIQLAKRLAGMLESDPVDRQTVQGQMDRISDQLPSDVTDLFLVGRSDQRVLASTSVLYSPYKPEDGTVEFQRLDSDRHPWIETDIEIGESFISDPIFITCKIAHMDFVSEVDAEGEYILVVTTEFLDTSIVSDDVKLLVIDSDGKQVESTYDYGVQYLCSATSFLSYSEEQQIPEYIQRGLEGEAGFVAEPTAPLHSLEDTVAAYAPVSGFDMVVVQYINYSE
jgi:hypothetical protein